jgi:segregation and condensation protein A
MRNAEHGTDQRAVATSVVEVPESALSTRIPGFEGPLAVLLRLIEREELDITAISLAQVADQFVDYIAGQPDSDPAILAEFAAVASRLLLLKTRVLFPRPPAAPDREREEDDADDLVRQLQEYRQFKAIAEGLAARDRADGRTFFPVAAPDRAMTGAVAEITLAPARAFDLVRVVQRRIARQPAAPRLLTLAPRISVGEMIGRLVEALRAQPHGDVRFSRVIPAPRSRIEIITTFMAILELVRRRRAEAVQDEPFGEIVVLPVTVELGALNEVAADA